MNTHYFDAYVLRVRISRDDLNPHLNASSSTDDPKITPQIPACPYVFVHENHPVINLLRINKSMVGVDVDEQQKMDNQWIKVTNSLFDASCDAIQNRILDKIQTHDFNNLTVGSALVYLTLTRTRASVSHTYVCT